MTFYQVIWLLIFVTGGITLGILGLSDINYFSLLIINPPVMDSLLISTEAAYLSHSGGILIPEPV